MADQDIKMLIERIMAEARTHQSARFSHEVYADEPILKTGRQMQNFLPDQYRKMREISRWQEDPKGGAGRWLSLAQVLSGCRYGRHRGAECDGRSFCRRALYSHWRH